MIEKIDEDKIDEESSKAIKPNHIYLDAVMYFINLIIFEPIILYKLKKYILFTIHLITQ